VTHILALDTTSPHASISILKEEEILCEYNFSSQDRLSASLIPVIDFLLKDCGLKLSALDVFGVAIGPGLFTGIRVGLAALKGLLFAAGKPVVGVMTLKALVHKYSPNAAENDVLIPLIDARRNEVYAAGYTIYRGEIKEVMAPFLVHIDALKNELTTLQTGGGIIFLGSGAEVHKELLTGNFKSSKIYYRSSFLAAEIGKMTYHDYLRKNYITDLRQLLPFYIRKPDAERNLTTAAP
jgi:tRNA threonylcarbamoyladenosine biosynthesis protein TsaB